MARTAAGGRAQRIPSGHPLESGQSLQRRLFEYPPELGPAARGRAPTPGVRDPGQFESAFAAMADARARALIVVTDPLTVRYRSQIVDLAAKSRLPAMYGFREFVDAGGLMAYGANLPSMCRRAAGHVDRILKGAKAGELPVEQPRQFELVINLKTARVLGIAIPPALLFQADEMIQ